MITRREFVKCAAVMPVLWRMQGGGGQRSHAYAYVTCGDNQMNLDSLPVDSPATVEAIFEFLSQTFQMKRVYWRGEQDRMWLRYHEIRPAFLRDYFDWLDYLDDDLHLNDVAIEAAHRRGMEIYVFDGLLDLGSVADTSGDGMYPYIHEDRLRQEHPEWVPVDRWGERLCPGPIDYCYPEARKALIERYLYHVTHYKYDGIFFYTYVENCGVRYYDEYGFNDPVVAEYKRRHGIDIRNGPFDKQAWYRLRGEYITQFVRELHTALSARGKKLSMALYPPTPNLPEPWDGSKVDVPQIGGVYLDWEGWVRDGIVDELFVWWRGPQKELAQQASDVCRGKPVEVTVAAGRPFDSEWQPLEREGVTPVGVWAPGYSLDRVNPEPSQAGDLKKSDWRWRMQALADVTKRKLDIDAAAVAALVNDPHVLVRRQAIFSLKTLGATAYVPLLEKALKDKESSVRIAAAVALASVNGPDTPRRIVEALSYDNKFQMKLACVQALSSMKELALPTILRGINDPLPAVREVCIRALAAEAPQCPPDSPRKVERAPCVHLPGNSTAPGAEDALISAFHKEQDQLVLYYATLALGGYHSPRVIRTLLTALPGGTPMLQMWIVQELTDMTAAMTAGQTKEMFQTLHRLFLQFGDDCKRPDAAWGWRAVGNALLACGQAGKEDLERMRTQSHDRWLAWHAYEVLYVSQTLDKVTLVTEIDAIASHAKYAPPFPGRRT